MCKWLKIVQLVKWYDQLLQESYHRNPSVNLWIIRRLSGIKFAKLKLFFSNPKPQRISDTLWSPLRLAEAHPPQIIFTFLHYCLDICDPLLYNILCSVKWEMKLINKENIWCVTKGSGMSHRVANGNTSSWKKKNRKKGKNCLDTLSQIWYNIGRE